jgi:hypothetical protein
VDAGRDARPGVSTVPTNRVFTRKRLVSARHDNPPHNYFFSAVMNSSSGIAARVMV